MIKVCRLFFLCLCVSVSPLLAQARYVLVDSENQLVDQFIKPYVGKRLSLASIDEIVREISQSGLFQLVYAENISDDKVVIRAQESQRLLQMKFTGSASFTVERLAEQTGLKVGSATSTLEIKQAVEKLQKLYQDAGYYDTSISYRKELTDTGLILEILFSEGVSTEIAGLEINSKNSRLNKELYNRLLGFIGLPFKRFSSAEIEKEIEAYLLERRFLTAKIANLETSFNQDKTKVKLIINISDPTIFEFVFHGNHSYSHFDLIKQSQIDGKFLYLSDSSSEMSDSIRVFYLQRGFAQVTIDYEEQYFADLDKKVIILKINEGRRIRLGHINVVGKISQPRSYYIDQIENDLTTATHNIYFVREEIDKAVENLIINLKNHGYLLAEHISTTVTIDQNFNASIEILIDEGILTYIRQVIFRGATAFNNVELRDLVGLRANSPLVLQSIERSFAILEEFYRDRGYLEFTIENRDANVIKYNAGQPFADIVYQIVEGPQIIVKDILVKGNSKTKEYVVRRELDFEKGDVLTQPKIQRSIDLLEKSGLFSEVRINSLEKGSADRERTIMVEITERDPGLFVAGGGVNNELDIVFRGYTGVSYNNLDGKARGLSARADLEYSTRPGVNYLENRLAFGYYEPYLFKDRIRGRVSLVRQEEVFSITKQQTPNTPDLVEILSRNDIYLSAEKELNRHLRVNYNVWGFSNQTTFESNDRSDSKTINIGTTGPSIEFDYRNDEFLPSSGSLTRWDFEYSDPILGSSKADSDSFSFADENSKEVNYFKTTLGTSLYFPLSKSRRWVWANSFRGGYLKNVSSREVSGVPAVKSFFLGGSSTIRGYQNTIDERIPSIKELCVKQLQPNGKCSLQEFFVRNESTYFLVKTELRFPLTASLGGLLFYDGGAVYYTNFDLQDNYRDSVGTGLRFETPVGAFVIEVGFKLDRKATKTENYNVEDPFAIHFSLGNF